MDKRHFNKTIISEISKYNLHKIKADEYFLHSTSEDFSLVLKLPDSINGFLIGILPDSDEHHSIKFGNVWLKNYEFSLDLCFFEKREYTEAQIRKAVERVVQSSREIAESGKVFLRERIDDWMIVGGAPERNKVYLWLGLPAVAPYSLEYLTEQVDLLKHGGAILLTGKEFSEHMEYYEKYKEYGFKIVFLKDGTVMIAHP